jgi:hypothetical protein
MKHRVFVGDLEDGRQVLVQLWDSFGRHADVAFRDRPWDVWDPPRELIEQKFATNEDLTEDLS